MSWKINLGKIDNFENTFNHYIYHDLTDLLPILAPEDTHDETTRDFTEPSATNTSSWLREHNMTADIHSYARHTLLRRREYFFKLWVNAKNLFK